MKLTFADEVSKFTHGENDYYAKRAEERFAETNCTFPSVNETTKVKITGEMYSFEDFERRVKEINKTSETFSTGAKRDTQSGKGRYDLLPWCVIERWAKFAGGLDKIPRAAIHRYAQRLEYGSTHYGDWNWTKGIPSSRYVSSLLRHAYQVVAGCNDEDHLAAVIFNAGGLIWNEVNQPEMNDLPEMDLLLHTDYVNDLDAMIKMAFMCTDKRGASVSSELVLYYAGKLIEAES